METWAYIPCLGQESKWIENSKVRYNNLLGKIGKSHIVLCHNGSYNGPQVIHNRNSAMLEGSDIVLALWSGKQNGGTYDTIIKARNKELEIVNFYPKQN